MDVVSQACSGISPLGLVLKYEPGDVQSQILTLKVSARYEFQSNK